MTVGRSLRRSEERGKHDMHRKVSSPLAIAETRLNLELRSRQPFAASLKILLHSMFQSRRAFQLSDGGQRRGSGGTGMLMLGASSCYNEAVEPSPDAAAAMLLCCFPRLPTNSVSSDSGGPVLSPLAAIGKDTAQSSAVLASGLRL
jgi:hypothetical protein